MVVFALWSAPRARSTAFFRFARWHTDASNSSGFERREREYPHTVENSEMLARYAAHHRPFYEQLHAQRLDVTPWERMAGSYLSALAPPT
jgi:hypothetical protein